MACRLRISRNFGWLIGDGHHAAHAAAHATHAAAHSTHAAAHATHAAAHAAHAAAHTAHAAAHATTHTATHAAHHATHDWHNEVAYRVDSHDVRRVLLVGDLHDFVLNDISQIQRFEDKLQC